eukprot:m51a1_g8617 hypothetical protein (135) ;mRNA; r:59540-60494
MSKGNHHRFVAESADGKRYNVLLKNKRAPAMLSSNAKLYTPAFYARMVRLGDMLNVEGLVLLSEAEAANTSFTNRTSQIFGITFLRTTRGCAAAAATAWLAQRTAPDILRYASTPDASSGLLSIILATKPPEPL